MNVDKADDRKSELRQSPGNALCGVRLALILNLQ